MILRQFCARHGRTVLSRSLAASNRCSYATSISDRTLTPSTGDSVAEHTFPGHPDEASSILDTSPLAPTGRTRRLEKEIESSEATSSALQSEFNASIAAATGGISSDPGLINWDKQERTLDVPFESFKEFSDYRKTARREARSATRLTQIYDPTTVITTPPSAADLTLPMLLAHQTHLGHHTSLWNPANSSYIFGTREGIHIISLDITYAYLKRAAKVVHEVARRGGLILFIGTRKGQTDTVVRSAKRAGGYHIFDRWVPGTLTNGQQLLAHCDKKAVNIRDEELTEYADLLDDDAGPALRPDLVICLNPLENQVCLQECGRFTIPTIGVIDTDANPSWVTYPIPANDDSHRSIALIAGVLGRAGEEGQKLRRQEALRGNATYDIKPAGRYLRDANTIANMEISHEKPEGKKDDE